MIDQKEASGKMLSFECCTLLGRVMKNNPEDKEIQQKFQETINLLFEKFPDTMPCPK